MSTYGSETKRVVARKDLGVLKIGSDTYALVNFVEWRRSYPTFEAPVLGLDKRLQGSEPMTGTVTIRRAYSTDKDLLSITKPSSGIVPESTITIIEKDTQGSPATATWTITARLDTLGQMFNVAGFVWTTVSGRLTDEPSVAYT